MSDLVMEQQRTPATGKDASRKTRKTDRVRSVLINGILGLVLAAAGAAAMWLYQRPGANHKAASLPAPFSPTSAEVPTEPSEIEVTLPTDALERVHLKTAEVSERPLAVSVRVPGVVQSNGYREVHVTPLVGGVVTKAFGELGQWVKRGQPLARVFSSELAEAQTHFLTMRAELDAEHKRLKRTEELVAIGAASRQELEAVQASHAVHQSHVRAAQQRLVLLGLKDAEVANLADSQRITSEIPVPAPIDGFIVSRMANLGQVVALGQELFTVTDLSTVWIMGDLFEKDFAAVQVGSQGSITTPAYPGRTYQGRVSYVDPRVDPQTRTAKVRVEVANTGVALKLGMYVDVSLQTAQGTKVAVVPSKAVQTLGSKQVVYLPASGEEGRFIQRTVKLGEELEFHQRVLEGLKTGDQVVTEGSFVLRAESLRQHPIQ